MRYAEIIERERAGVRQPSKPLTPTQAAAKAQRQRDIEKKIKDQQRRCADRVRELRLRLSETLPD